MERLIGLLDLLDTLAEDMEDDDPDGGNVEDEPQLDVDDEGEDDRSDLGPSLGSVAYEPNWLGHTQEHWAAGTTDDTEDEHDGLEPGEDEEPSLGAPERHPSLGWGTASFIAGHRVLTANTDLGHTQALWAQGSADDEREVDPAEMGIADGDGLAEQGFGR